MKNKSQIICDYLVENTDRYCAPILLHQCAAEAALSLNLASPLNDAEELVETLLTQIQELLLQKRLEATSQGVSWSIELYGSENDWLRGASFDDRSLSPIDSGVRARRAYCDHALAEIRSFTPVEFEAACSKVLALLGCADPYTSPVRDDGGIDFYGMLSLKGRLDSPLPLGGIDNRARVWLIGQAKHYPKRAIQTAVIREIIGSVELARTKGAIHAWEGLELRPFDPVVILVFTAGWFSSGSGNLLEKSGALSMTGEQLAIFLCDAGVGFTSPAINFDARLFRNYMLA